MAQELRDFMSTSPPIYTSQEKIGIQEKPSKFYQSNNVEQEFLIYSNYFNDTSTFDFLFDKRTLKLKSNDKIRIELKDGNSIVYTKTDSVGHFKNVYLTNAPSCSDCYAIRINLLKYPHLFLNEIDEIKSFKLYITDVSKNKVIYGNSPNDLKFIFIGKPEEIE